MATKRKAYIFLDVDGVLNSLRTLIAYGDYTHKSLDPVAVMLVTVLCEALAAEGYEPVIVVTSDWRLKREYQKLDFWQTHLNLRGSPHVNVIGFTPECRVSLSRGNEIVEYLLSQNENYARCTWVAFDDQPLGEHDSMRVQVDPHSGLTHDNIEEAFNRLTGRRLLPEGLDYMGKWQAIKAWGRVKESHETAWTKQSADAEDTPT